MTYNPSTPQPQTLPSSDQDDFLDNFRLLNTFFRTDHSSMGNGMTNGSGLHKKITLNKPLSEGPMSLGAGIFPNSSAVYSKFQSTNATRSSLYFQNGLGSTFELLMTSLNVIKGNGENGYGVVTPWGIIFNFGMVNDNTINQIFDFPIPFTSKVFSIVNCGVQQSNLPGVDQYHYTNAVSLTQFISRSTSIANFFGFSTWYIAVGK